jgi:hypothetical protein
LEAFKAGPNPKATPTKQVNPNERNITDTGAEACSIPGTAIAIIYVRKTLITTPKRPPSKLKNKASSKN